MAWQIPTSISTAGVGAELSLTFDLFVAKGILVASTGDYAVHGSGSGHDVIVAGTVATGGLDVAIFLGGNFSGDQANTVTVDAGGEVRSQLYFGVMLFGFNNQITNNGLISGAEGSIYLKGVHGGTTTTIVNNGTMVTPSVGISIDINSTETVTFTNHGTLSGATAYGNFGGPAINSDIITNTGRIIGKIDLSGGGDSYNGAAGHLTGIVLGGAGIDTITGGVDNDNFDGGTENDTLKGNAGNDLLKGDAGVDTLFGGLGKDKLIGGTENDFFVFNTKPNTSNNFDTISDFVHGHDKIQLAHTVFNTLGAGPALNPAFFHLGTAAADANDHIIYDRPHGKLFYDINGNASGGSALIAILSTHPVLTAADFKVI
jgi:Ca2+-binding RTX toxin-like protein